MSIDSVITIILGPWAEYLMIFSSVASSSLIGIIASPKSVESVFFNCISISHARCFLLAFLRINSPLILWFLTVPFGFKEDSSDSLRIACNLSPEIESTSIEGLKIENLGSSPAENC